MTASDHAQQRSQCFSLAWKGASTDGKQNIGHSVRVLPRPGGPPQARRSVGKFIKFGSRSAFAVAGGSLNFFLYHPPGPCGGAPRLSRRSSSRVASRITTE